MQAKNEHTQKAREVLDFINSNDHFLVSAHINADGDAIASVLAIGMFLDQLNKKYSMVLHDQEIDQRFNYLNGFDNILHYSDQLDVKIESALILDVPGTHRLGDVAKLLPGQEYIAKIDHHPPENDFAIVNFADENASSTTQLIYEILEVAGVSLDVGFAHHEA